MLNKHKRHIFFLRSVVSVFWVCLFFVCFSLLSTPLSSTWTLTSEHRDDWNRRGFAGITGPVWTSRIYGSDWPFLKMKLWYGSLGAFKNFDASLATRDAMTLRCRWTMSNLLKTNEVQAKPSGFPSRHSDHNRCHLPSMQCRPRTSTSGMGVQLLAAEGQVHSHWVAAAASGRHWSCGLLGAWPRSTMCATRSLEGHGRTWRSLKKFRPAKHASSKRG